MKGNVFQAGIARRVITPPPQVELAGLGYYLERKAERVRDNLNATALVIEDGMRAVCIIAMDLMYNDAGITRKIRQRIASRTGMTPESICVNFSHSHNAPTAGLILGAGEREFVYLDSAACAAGEAAIEAWQARQSARLKFGTSHLEGMTFNRTRENGPVDTMVSVFQIDTAEGKPLGVAVNFHSHCTAHMEVDLHAVGRDWPGEVVDGIEAEIPGCMAMYLQGTCGDVNFRREYNGTEKRFEPGHALTKAALKAIEKTRKVEKMGVAAESKMIKLPTRRWGMEEIKRDRDEGLYRLKSGDTKGWLDGVAKVCVNLPERLPLRYGGSVDKAVRAVSRFAVEWTDLVLPDLETRPEWIETEVQAMRIGDVYFCANSSELFTTTGLAVREQVGRKDLMMLGYSNGSIGYLPDAYDVRRKSYAAIQSAKFTGQFPFTEGAADVMAEGLADVVRELTELRGSG